LATSAEGGDPGWLATACLLPRRREAEPLLSDTVSLPTLVSGRVLWPLGSTPAARAAALPEASQACQRAAVQQEPSYRVRGILPDGGDSPTTSRRPLLPGARLGHCLRQAINKRPGKHTALPSAVRTTWRSPGPTLGARARQRRGWGVVALGPRWRPCGDHVTPRAGAANGERVRYGCQDKQGGWYAVLTHPQRPVTSTRREQAHNAMERKLFAMQGCHHPKGSQEELLIGLAQLYHLLP
jgi:hypothetical protein